MFADLAWGLIDKSWRYRTLASIGIFPARGERVMKKLADFLIVMAFMVVLPPVFGSRFLGTPPAVFADDIVVQPDLHDIRYDPEKGEDRLVPANYKRMYDPGKQSDVLMPDYYVRKFDPERRHDRLVPNGYVAKYDPEKGYEKLVPDYYVRRYDPEQDRDRLVPRDYKKIYDPEKGHEVLVSGGYTTIRDEFGNEIGRIRTSEILKLIKQRER